MARLKTTYIVPCAPEALYQRLSSDWSFQAPDGVKLELQSGSSFKAGNTLVFRVHRLGVSHLWGLQVVSAIAGKEICLRQKLGWLKTFEIRTELQEENGSTRVTEQIQYTLPFGPLGALADDLVVSGDIKTLISSRELNINSAYR